MSLESLPDDFHEDGDCPNCGGEGMVWGCFEDTCVCVDDEGLGCSPSRCDWCKPVKKVRYANPAQPKFTYPHERNAGK